MRSATLIGSLMVLCVAPGSWATTTGDHTGSGFCYNHVECGPESDEWSELCHTGLRQSPIDLPAVSRFSIRGISPKGSSALNLKIYRGDSFRMINNGHSVQIDFDNKGPSTQIISLPDPSHVDQPNQHNLEYKFASAHFHWGVSDYETGSEHCIAGKCSAMEVHFVHYLAKYGSQAEAINSKNESALAVIGVLVDVSIPETVMNALSNAITGKEITNGSGTLAPIVNNLHTVQHADHEGTHLVTVDQRLDLSGLLTQGLGAPLVYTYKGSLTTPGCNEQVNWFVLQKPAVTSHQNLDAFRRILEDGSGEQLNENHRPLQRLNGRVVKCFRA